MTVLPVLAQPSISGFSPASGATGSISGSGFNATAAQSAVFFGASRASVTAASTGRLTVTVPGETTYRPLSATNLGTGYARLPFVTTGAGAYSVNTGDVDGDGKPDLVTVNNSTASAAVLRQTAPSAPAITSLSPTSGPVGTSVTISGSGLNGATAVSFNGTSQNIITGNTDTSLSVNVPAGATTGNLTVTTASGTSNPLTFTVTPPAPVVTSVSVSAKGTYRAGQSLDFLVTFDQAVTVTRTPILALTVGSTARSAGYVSGSGNRYAHLPLRRADRRAGHRRRGAGHSINLNGGTIRNSNGADADPDLNDVGSTAGLLVDAVAPTVTISSPAGSSTSALPISVTITFSELVTGFAVNDITP